MAPPNEIFPAGAVPEIAGATVPRVDADANTSFNSSALWGGMAIGGSLGSAAGSIVGGFLQAGLIKKQAEIAEQRAQFNHKMANLHADKIVELGDETAREYMQNVSDLVGRQKSTYAAQGVKVGTGVAEQMERQTRQKAQEQVLKIKNNAWNQAFGIRTGASDMLSQAAFARGAAGLDAARSILGGATAATQNLFQAAWMAKDMK